MDFTSDIYTPAHRRQVLRICYRILRDIQDAEDAAQEAFFNAFKGLDRFDGRSSLSTWLNRVARNAALNVLRQRPEVEMVSLSMPAHSEFEDVTVADTLPAPGISPDDWLFVQEVFRAINNMPNSYRQSLWLMLKGYTHEEIAMTMAISISTVAPYIFHARRRVREALAT